MRRISKPLTALKSHYEVVVIGSGYGGGIAASRFSRAGMQVCILEKGKEFLPGEFPKNLNEARKEMQFNKGNFDMGSENGLYDFTMGDDISVFKGCGLGGTSLVNANVSIEADPRIFEDSVWPDAIKNDLQSVKVGIAKARKMLRPNKYPEGQNGYPVLKKTEAMRKSAAAMGEKFDLMDINVTFETTVNQAGVTQPSCTNCGDCVTGCNRGAKNTTAMNYLPDAYNHGAEIFTQVGVSYIESKGDKWLIHFKPYNIGREKFGAPSFFISADKVVLSAGSLGSTEILLRSKNHGLDVSDMLGKRFTGNGDVLGFGYNCDQKIKSIGIPGAAFSDEIVDVGPCITGVIDTRANASLEDGMTLEEGVVPGVIKSIVTAALEIASPALGKDTDKGFMDFLREKWRAFLSLFGGAYTGSIDNTVVYLVMSNDDGNGKMELKKDNLVISWGGVGEQPIFKKVNEKLKAATAALGGTFIANPSWTKSFNYGLVTVHPLGGCAMGNNASVGVVDHKGQVFKGKTGSDLHAGLYVMDGAVLPRPVGTNPLLTISGLAERSVLKIVEENGKSIEYGGNADPLTDVSMEVGVQFTETMRGYFSIGETEDYQKGHDKGVKDNSPFEFTLTVMSQDVKKLVTQKDHAAEMIGTMLAPKLSEHALMAYDSTFNLFVEDEKNPGHKKMLYMAKLKSREGKEYYFEGFKDVFDDKGFDMWKDTTTLFITVYDGNSAASEILGKGKLIIEIKDFTKQLTTMNSINASSKAEGRKAIAEFGKYFAGKVYKTYV